MAIYKFLSLFLSLFLFTESLIAMMSHTGSLQSTYWVVHYRITTPIITLSHIIKVYAWVMLTDYNLNIFIRNIISSYSEQY